MQRSSNPSSIKIQMNNFTLNLQTLLSKDNQQLPTTQRKNNKTQRRTKSNFQQISPLKVKKKNKDKDKEYVTVKNKPKKQELFQIVKVHAKPSKQIKQNKQAQTSRKTKKNQPKNFIEPRSKSRKDKSSKLQRHFTQYDHVIESARLRTSPSQNYNHYNFNSESISKSASRSRSKSYKKIQQEKTKNNKSRQKSIFSSNTQRLNTQRSISKLNKKKTENKQKSPAKKATQNEKKKRSSKSRQKQRKSIDNYSKMNKSKSRQRIYTQISQRHPLDSKHFNSDHFNQIEEKIFLSHKKSKSRLDKHNENLMSNSSEMGVLGPKFTSNKINSKEKIIEKSPIKKKNKKLSGTVSAANIQKPHQNQKDKKLNASKKLSSKTSKKQSTKQKSSLDSQYNFYQSTNIQKKKFTEQDLNEVFEKTTSKKSKKLKTEAGNQYENSKFEPVQLSGLKKGKKEQGQNFVIQKAFKKKKVIDIVQQLFEQDTSNEKIQHDKKPRAKKQVLKDGSLTERFNRSKQEQQDFSSSATKARQFPQSKKLTIQTDFNQIQNKEIYFDDISKILLKQKNPQSVQGNSKHSISRSQKSIKQEIMQSRNQSIYNESNSHQQQNQKSRKSSRILKSQEEQNGQQKFEYLLYGNKKLNFNQESRGDSFKQVEEKKSSQIRKIQIEDLEESQSESSEEQNHYSSEDEQPQKDERQQYNQKQVIKEKSQSQHQLDELEQLNNHLEKMIEQENSKKSSGYQINSPQRISSQSNISIKEQASFGIRSPIRQLPKSLTLIETQHEVNKTNNQNSERKKPLQKKVISSNFIYFNEQNRQSPLCSPSSYAVQNKQKVMSSLNKPRKSTQQQFKIAKTLSNKRLLEELQLLDTLQKIQKSVQNSLIYQNGRHYGGLNKHDDNIVQEQQLKNYFSEKSKHQQKLIDNKKSPVQFNNSDQEQQLNQLQNQLLLSSTSNKHSIKNQFLFTNSPNEQLQKSPQTMLLHYDQIKQQKQDSPLLSSCQNQFKRSPINTTHHNQLKVNPFQPTYQELQNFFSNQRSFQQIKQRKTKQTQIQLIVNNSTKDNSSLVLTKKNNSQTQNELKQLHNSEQEDSQFQFNPLQQNSSLNSKKVEYSQLTLEFQKEMEDYLKDNQKPLVKSKIQLIKQNASLIQPKLNTLTESILKKQQKDSSLQKSDDFFYYNNNPPTKEQQITTKQSTNHLQQNHSQLIKTQLCEHVFNKMMGQFCELMSNNKVILHKFLYFISSCNLVVMDSAQNEQFSQLNKIKQQRQVNQEQFMEYLQSKIYANNQFILNLANQIIQFVKRSPQNEEIFVRNINKSFGIQPLKTLKWMRKVYADEDKKKEKSNDEEDNYQENDQNQQQEEENNQQSVSGLSDCQSVQAIFPPTLLADFDAYQSQIVFQQMNQQQFYLNHAVYAALNQVCDKHRPFGQNGYPVLTKYKPKLTKSITQIQPKIISRLNHILSLRWGRIQFAPDQEPQRIITQTYRRMDEDIRMEDDERWSERNMEDTIFENVYYLATHIIDGIINQEVMEVFRMFYD